MESPGCFYDIRPGSVAHYHGSGGFSNAVNNIIRRIHTSFVFVIHCDETKTDACKNTLALDIISVFI